MANYAKIEIDIVDDQPLLADIDIILDSESVHINSVSVLTRSNPGEFTRQHIYTVAASNLGYAFLYDYAPGGNLASFPINVTLSGTVITIEATEYGHVFTLPLVPIWVDATITPEVSPDPVFRIDTVTISEADGATKCGKAKYTLTLFDNDSIFYPVTIISPVNKVCASASELFFDYDRYPVPEVALELVANNSDIDSEELIRVASIEITSIDVLEAFTGATITIETQLTGSGALSVDKTFSLDGVTYQDSNIYYGLTPGNYTAYVKDSLGCIITDTFDVIGVTVDKPEPIFNISDANSLKFYKDSEFVACGEQPNFDNAPIYKQKYFNLEGRYYEQLVQKCDAITIQLRTNYETVAVDIIDCDDEVVDNPVVTEKRTYINQKDKRDCKIKAGATGKTNVYFPGGDMYIPGTSTPDGTYSNPSLNLPDFADDGTIQSGIYVTLSDNAYLNGDFLVNNKVFDEDINGWAYEITAIYTSLNESEDAIVQSLYNAEDWNTLEFTIGWSTIDEGSYIVKVTATDTDPRYDEIVYYSEPINNAIEHLKSILIEYTNSTNINLIDYSTGLINYLRVPARFIKHRDGGESENFETDTGSKQQLRGVETNEVELESSLIPQYLKKKISIASIHDNLKIENVESTLVEKGDQEDLFGNNNRFYKFKAWYQVGDTIEISDNTGLSTSQNVIGAGGVEVIGA